MIKMIREIKPEEIILLKDFLYYAIFQKDPDNPIPMSVIEQPEIALYINNFGSMEHDYCLVYEEENQLIGAAWIRMIDGFGSLGPEIPELSMSVSPEYRGQGVGTDLLKRLIENLAGVHDKISLSVQKENYAAKMYQKLGFEIVKEKEEEYIMLYQFR